MKRCIPLLLVVAAAWFGMAQYSAANRRNAEAVASSVVIQQDAKESNRNGEELKNPVTKAIFDLLGQAEDLEEGDRDEAEKSIFEADRILTQYKNENRKALAAWNHAATAPHKRPVPKKKAAKDDAKADDDVAQKETVPAEAASERTKFRSQLTESLLEEVDNAEGLTAEDREQARRSIAEADAILSKSGQAGDDSR